MSMMFTLLPAEAMAVVADNVNTAVNTMQEKKKLENPFADILEGSWYYDAVQYARINGLFSGTSAKTFDPDGTMSRGMFVTVLGRMAGVDESAYQGQSAFGDVGADAYYAPYVAWAMENGIASGIGGGKFSPDDLVNRQQMATFIVRLFDAYGYTYPAATVTSTPEDIDSVAPYAKDAVLKLWACGLFAGDAGKFNPNNNASRAEAATFLMRTDRHLVESGFKQAPDNKPGKETPSNPGGGGGNGNGDGGGIDTYTLTFNTMGGAALADKRLPSGAKLNDLPTPYKINEIFQGWYKDAERSKPVSATDTISGNMTLYAGYRSAEGVTEQAMSPFVSAIGVSSAFTINITDDSDSMTADAVKAALAYSCLTNPEFTDIRVAGSGGNFTVDGNGGWQEGSTNKLELLDERLHFTSQDPTADIYNFTVQKAEVLSLQLNSGIIYLPVGSIGNITQDGADVYGLSIPLATVQAGRSAAVQTGTGTTTGSFTYTARMRGGEEIKVGDTVAIYEGTCPDQRTLNTDENNYADEDVAYVVITEIDGDQYT